MEVAVGPTHGSLDAIVKCIHGNVGNLDASPDGWLDVLQLDVNLKNSSGRRFLICHHEDSRLRFRSNHTEGLAMWHMQDGRRVLYPGEWKLMRQAAESLLDMIDSDKRLGKRARKLGVSAFDRLSYQQKTVLLCQVVHALHDPLVPEMPLSSMSESVVAALFKMMHEILRFNLAFQPPDEKDAQLQFRKAILKAARESNEPLKNVPLLRSTELEPWAEVLNEIEERVLWDADYAMDEMFLDLPPDQAQQKKEFLRIDQDYFVAVAPDPTEVEYETARHRLIQLLKESA